jgi:hypothetical protein
MTPRPRLSFALVAAAMAVLVGIPGVGGVLANGVGDLYVATPAGVHEVYLLGGSVVETVPIEPGPVRLAFTPDGRSLYAGDGSRSLVRIDLESISLAQTYHLPAAAAGIAHPRGDALLLAYPDSRALGILIAGDDTPSAGPGLPGPADILAADRRETRVVAAARGQSWVAIVEPASAAVTKVDVEGKVTAIAIARDEGFAYVATTGPDRLALVSLDSGTVTWSTPLDGAPADVTAIPSAAIVAVGDRLVRVAAGKAGPWTDLPADTLRLATSDEGGFVYAGTASTVYAIAVADPTAKPAASVKIPGGTPATLAPVPRSSSLARAGAGAASIGQPGSSPGVGSGGHASGPPATDTTSGGARFRPAGPDALTLFGSAGVIALVLMAGARLAFRRLLDEH